jgi:CRISPR system Cascade subunit CasC
VTRTIIDIHIVQTLPPSNINRDDTGSPKTATYGGVRRARVSSQAWKRATRDAFKNELDTSDLGVRTKRVVEVLGERIAARHPGLAERAHALAAEVFKAGGIKVSKPSKGEGPDESGYLVFLSSQQLDALAEIAAAAADGGELDKKAVREAFKNRNSIDVALFGRMVAEVTDLNVDAAVQVAHALGVHAVETEFDYYTAVDDHKQDDADEDAGAGMIGTVEFNSSTLYRYATLDLDALQNNLGDTEATRRALTAFLRAFTLSMPTGKQNTFANRTLPDAVLVGIRSDQPVSYVGAFEDPVSTRQGGRVTVAVQRLADYAGRVHDAYGAAPEHSWFTGVGDPAAALEKIGERLTFDALVQSVADTVNARLEPTP